MFNIIKKEGNVDWDDLKLPYSNSDKFVYLGHNQAPTGVERKWGEKTSHPFETGNWIVAHNGVLTNYKELIKDYIPDYTNTVDSSIIPALLDNFERTFGPCDDSYSETQNILYTIEKLKGTFALWIVNSKTKNVYIARQGSTLFYKDSNISSIKGKGYNEVEEGYLYSYNEGKLIKRDSFTHDSPFLTL